MSTQSKELLASPPVAEDTFEQAAIRLHALLDNYLSISRVQKEADQGFRPAGAPARKIIANEFGMREALAETCRRVEALVVNPTEEMMTISYAAPVLAAMKAINDLNIPNLIPLEGDIAVEELAQRAGVESDFLERLLRPLVANYIFTITAPERFAHTHFSATLRDKTMADLMMMGTAPGFRSAAVAPDVWRAQGYKSPESALQVPFQKAHNTDLSLFQYMNDVEPVMGSRFHSAMEGWGKFTQELTLDTFPFNEVLGEEQVVFVDVGGGQGHMMKKVLARWPGLKGRVVVQDQVSTLEDMGGRTVEGIEFMGSDFFEGQPVKDADFYLLRRIMHDWPDKACLTILNKIAEAMTPGKSKILVADFVMPEIDVPRYRSASDIMMAALIGGAERTERQWIRLLARTDKKMSLEKIWAHPLDKEFVLQITLD